jgi:hypothetical protein
MKIIGIAFAIKNEIIAFMGKLFVQTPLFSILNKMVSHDYFLSLGMKHLSFLLLRIEHLGNPSRL